MDRKKLQEIGFVKFAFHRALTTLLRKKDNVLPKELNNLDAAAGYTTPEEMAELLEYIDGLNAEPRRPGTVMAIGYRIDPDYSIRIDITNILCFPKF